MKPYSYNLLIEKYESKILETLKSSKCSIITGPTGCGKSTFVPFLISKRKLGRIAIIEPRRIAVTSLYSILKDVIPNLNYKMRFDFKKHKNSHATIFTDGMFINELLNLKETGRLEYDYIIVDEVHERSIRIDLILGILKFYSSKFDGKLILMSATCEVEKLQNYFDASLIEIKGNCYPCTIYYEEKCVSDYIIESFLKIKEILKNEYESKINSKSQQPCDENQKDILIFLPGEEDINELAKMLKRLPQIKVYKIHSTLNDTEQRLIFENCKLIKVILSTNICETSLTIPGIKYVIDTGLCKMKIHSSINYFGIKEITKESADQRLGRCNRIGPGICYRLYTQKTFNNLKKAQPEICRSDLSFIFLYLTVMNVDILNFKFLDYPSLENSLSAASFLIDKKCLKFEDSSKFIVTNYGLKLLKYPLDVNLSHFLEHAISNRVGLQASMIISLISQDNQNFSENSFNSSEKSDILYLLKLLREYKKCDSKMMFCKNNKVSFKGMERALLIHSQLSKNIEDNDDDDFIIEKVFSSCFEHNLSERQKDGSYLHLKKNVKVYLHPTSCFFRRKDKYIVYVDLFCTSKMYARVIGKFIGSKNQ